jgi:hypothetical protein
VVDRSPPYSLPGYDNRLRAGPFSDSTNYYWRAGLVRSAGDTAWSPAWQFSTKKYPSLSFPFSIGNRWYYRAGSTSKTATRLGVVKEVVDTTTAGFREVQVRSVYPGSMSIGREYWLNRGGLLYKTDTSLVLGTPVYDGGLTGDMFFNDVNTTSHSYSYHLFIAEFLGSTYSAQSCTKTYNPSGHSWHWWVTRSAVDVGIIYESDSYGPFGQADSIVLIGGLRNGVVWGDTALTASAIADPLNHTVPAVFILQQNYPNPFNSSTIIRYDLPQESHVTLRVFSTLGQQVAVLQNGEQYAGYHEVKFDASGFCSGVYYYRIQVHGSASASPRDLGSGAGEFVQTRKLLLTR